MSSVATASHESVHPSNGSGSLRALDQVKPLFILPDDSLADEVLIPGFREARRVDCMVGFFSSRVLASLAPGLATYIHNSKNSLRLVISPFLNSEDREAIEHGVKQPADVAHATMEQLLVTEDVIQRHTLKCLTWLLSVRRLEIKVAILRNATFHPKVWLFRCGHDTVAAHGSSNVTYAGVHSNVEQVAVSRSWHSATDLYVTTRFAQTFSELWANRHRNCAVIPMSAALREQLVQTYRPTTPPTESDLNRLLLNSQLFWQEKDNDTQSGGQSEGPSVAFAIPTELRYYDGPFAHQGNAVDAWCAADGRGILEMATGSGKTITSLLCTHRLHKDSSDRSLLAVVAAPYRPLVRQWCAEIERFGVTPCDVTALSGATERSRVLTRLRRRMRLGLSNVEIVVVSHDTLCTGPFVRDIESFDCTKLLIADEVHNLGRPSFIDQPPMCFHHRLGLSATPVRQYDEQGTEALNKYFGPIVFRFALKDAIGVCLVDYDYHVHSVHLNGDEMDEWYALTAKIGQNAWRSENDRPDEYLTTLLIQRRRILETAREKVPTLAHALEEQGVGNLRHTLIYTTDKAPSQLEDVNRLLHKMGVRFHQLTATETANAGRAASVVRSFRAGDISVLTAKRVLDEGFDVPEISRAYILASTTVERQWIQRRGRLLRTCARTNKTHSVIHDFVALPHSMNRLDNSARGLVSSELRRIQEFALLARNVGKPGGPQVAIDQLVDAAYLQNGH